MKPMPRSALLAADLVLIPVQPSPYDVWASAEMVSLIREAQVFRPALRAAFVINRRVSTTVIGREARGALADQPDDIHVFPMKHEFACLDLRHIQYVGNHFEQMQTRFVDVPDIFAIPVRQRTENAL